MKIAIPNWQGRVSPVFDVARDVLLVDVVDGLAQARTAVRMSEDEFAARFPGLWRWRFGLRVSKFFRRRVAVLSRCSQPSSAEI